MFNSANPQQLRDKLKTDKPIIFYASTFSPKLTSAPVLAPYIKQLSETGRWHWVITLHPKSTTETIETYRNMQNNNLTFIEPGEEVIPMLNAADAMLCDTSSIFIEFLLLNKPVVTFNTSVPGPHLIDINNLQEIESALASALNRPDELMQNIETYCKKIHPQRDGNASERILQATDHFIEHELKTLKAKPLNLGRKLQMRKKLKYYRIK
jgi:CDP-glycerol glycerophosphotransferase (TagB/SpsB family)